MHACKELVVKHPNGRDVVELSPFRKNKNCESGLKRCPPTILKILSDLVREPQGGLIKPLSQDKSLAKMSRKLNSEVSPRAHYTPHHKHTPPM
jgi:hypothetical protein